MPIFNSGLEALRKKYGPFTGWTWGTIGGAGVGAYLLFFHKSKPKLSISPTIGEGAPLYGNPGGGPGGTASPPTPPVDTKIDNVPPIINIPSGPNTVYVPAHPAPTDNYKITTPAGSLVTATPEAFSKPVALTDFLHNADIQKSITDSINPAMSEHEQYAHILRSQISAGTLLPDAKVSYGNNQHGTATEAITYYEQNGGAASSMAVPSPTNTGTPLAAGASQGYLQ